MALPSLVVPLVWSMLVTAGSAEADCVVAVDKFNAGPAALPAPVLEQARAELRDYRGRGLSIMEMSHRSPEYEAVNAEAESRLKRLLGLADGWRALFLDVLNAAKHSARIVINTAVTTMPRIAPSEVDRAS